MDRQDTKITPTFLLEALHAWINATLRPLANAANRGSKVVTSDGSSSKAHFLPASYLSDIPEMEGLLSSRRGADTTSPLHRHSIDGSSIGDSRCGFPNTHSRTLEVLHQDSRIEAVIEILRLSSMHPAFPVPHRFYFAATHSCVDVYSFSRWDDAQSFQYLVSNFK